MFRIALIALLLSAGAFAAIDVYDFDTESQRERYHALSDELRCPKCQNQNLSGSDSQIAGDLRRELHRLIQDGMTDKEIKDYMVARYGDFVLYKPRLQMSTLVLWGLPMLLLVGGFLAAVVIVRQKQQVSMSGESESSLSEQEQERLRQLTGDSEDKQ